MLTKHDFAKFPFTAEASAYIKSRNINPIELATPELLPILNRSKERISQAVFAGRLSTDFSEEDTDIIAYPTALMIISSIGDDRTRRRYALAEAKRAYQLLRDETPDKLLQIAVGSFGWDARLAERDVGDSHFEFAVHFTDYVRNSSRIRDIRWKLVNRVLSEGYVFVPREDFARLLEEEVQARVLEKTSDNIKLPPELEMHIAPLRSSLLARAQSLVADDMPHAVITAAIPPCMKNLLSLLQTSKHISHMGRFAMAAFLLNIGTEEDDLLSMFKAFTDFDAKIAKYQVEHIAGKRGSRQKYTPPNCATMQTHSLCVNPDELCAIVRHPLSYYRRKARTLYNRSISGKRLAAR
jgi:DNA primase large subunit